MFWFNCALLFIKRRFLIELKFLRQAVLLLNWLSSLNWKFVHLSLERNCKLRNYIFIQFSIHLHHVFKTIFSRLTTIRVISRSKLILNQQLICKVICMNLELCPRIEVNFSVTLHLKCH